MTSLCCRIVMEQTAICTTTWTCGIINGFTTVNDTFAASFCLLADNIDFVVHNECKTDGPANARQAGLLSTDTHRRFIPHTLTVWNSSHKTVLWPDAQLAGPSVFLYQHYPPFKEEVIQKIGGGKPSQNDDEYGLNESFCDNKVASTASMAKKLLFLAQHNAGLVLYYLLRRFCSIGVHLILALSLKCFYCQSLYFDVTAAKWMERGQSILLRFIRACWRSP